MDVVNSIAIDNNYCAECMSNTFCLAVLLRTIIHIYAEQEWCDYGLYYFLLQGMV